MKTKLLLLKFIKYISENHTDQNGYLEVIIEPTEETLKNYYSQTDIGVIEEFLKTIKNK